jgi:hypothetical protein
MTDSPRSRSASAMCEPMKPAPPVTKYLAVVTHDLLFCGIYSL